MNLSLILTKIYFSIFTDLFYYILNESKSLINKLLNSSY